MTSAVEVGIVIKADDKASPVIDKVKAFGRTAFKVLAASAAAAFAAVVALAKKAADLGDAAFTSAQKLGTTAEFVSSMGFAARQSGTDMATLEKGILTLSKKAIDGSKSFDKWGVTLRNTDGSLKNTEQLFLSAAEKVASIESPVKRAAAAQDLFGNSGKKLLPLLLEGETGIEALRARADELGITISSAAAVLGDQFNDQLQVTQDALDGSASKIGSVFLPIMIALLREVESAIGAFNRWAEANQELLRAGVIEALTFLADNVLPAIVTMIDLGAKAWRGWQLIIAGVQAAASGFAMTLLQTIGDASGAMAELLRLTGAESLAAELEGASKSAQSMANDFAAGMEAANDEMIRIVGEGKRFETFLEELPVRTGAAVRRAAADAQKIVADLSRGGAAGVSGESPASIGEAKSSVSAERAAKLSAEAASMRGKLKDELEQENLQRRIEVTNKLVELADQERAELEETKQAYLDYAMTVGRAAGDMFASMISGSASAGEAFRAFGAQLAKLALDFIAAKAQEAIAESLSAKKKIAANAASGASKAGESASELPFPANIIVAPLISAAMFALLYAFTSRFHSGGELTRFGLKPREIPIIGEEGEVMLSRRQADAARKRGEDGGRAPAQRVDAQVNVHINALSIPTTEAPTIRAVRDGVLPVLQGLARNSDRDLRHRRVTGRS